jgi:hypothetical protein
MVAAIVVIVTGIGRRMTTLRARVSSSVKSLTSKKPQ